VSNPASGPVNDLPVSDMVVNGGAVNGRAVDGRAVDGRGSEKLAKRQRGGVQPRTFTRDEIADAALAVTARSALDRLTVKAVADELGVTSPAIYYYIPGGRQELIELTASRQIDVASAGALEIREGEDWLETLLRIVVPTGRMAREYPGVIQYLMADGRETPANLRSTDFIVAQLLRGGFARAEAARVYVAVFAFVGGWATATPVSAKAARSHGLDQLADVLDEAEQVDPGHRPTGPARPARAGQALAQRPLRSHRRGPLFRLVLQQGSHPGVDHAEILGRGRWDSERLPDRPGGALHGRR
jgi:TetR/AcrR family tetracycline transcriptional repressor